MKRIFLTVSILGLLVFNTLDVKAQQDPMYTNYMFDLLSINPGYAGSRGVMNATALARKQWVGLDGAPRTNTFFIHSPIVRKHIGGGLSFTNDKVGPIVQNTISGDYSYTIYLGEKKHSLALGLKAGVNMISGALSSLETTQAGDQTFASDIPTTVKPNFGVGAYYHSTNWYLGFSAPRLIENSYEGTEEYSLTTERRHYFIMAGYVMDINPSLKFKPTVLTKMVQGAPLGIDLSANFLIKDCLWLGAIYRHEDAVGFLAQFIINNSLRIGYSYDISTSELRGYNEGSHEVMISYDFMSKKAKMLSPRYF